MGAKARPGRGLAERVSQVVAGWKAARTQEKDSPDKAGHSPLSPRPPHRPHSPSRARTHPEQAKHESCRAVAGIR